MQHWQIITILTLGALLLMSSRKNPIGIRNNNPLNLREVGIPWNGKTGENGGFTTFKTPFDGIRAAANDMKNGWLAGQRTLSQLISAWAPATENDTASYIAHVSSKTGIAANATILHVDQFVAIVKVMILHENGIQPYDKNLITEAVFDGITSGAQLPYHFVITPGELVA